MSCLAAELDPSLRVVVAEEVFETDIPLPNVAHMQTRPARPDRKEVDLRRLVAGFLRMAPDVAIVGEVRDREAMPLMLTLSSGVQGFTTIHAASARQALSRLRFICQLAETGSELSVTALSALVSEAVDVVVHCVRRGPDLRVTEVLAVEDLQVGAGTVTFTTTSVFARSRFGDPLAWTGQPAGPGGPGPRAGGLRRPAARWPMDASTGEPARPSVCSASSPPCWRRLAPI